MKEGLAAAVESVPWYHTIELPGGLITPGEYDLRPTLRKLPFPDSLAGQRCLDVGTHDGFWAFAMEQRGADSVVAIDVDDPGSLDWPVPMPPIGEETLAYLERQRRAFWIAHEALGSSVERLDLSVYSLSRERVGEFDFAFVGTLLHHLRDPVRALAAVRDVVRGKLLVCAVFSISKTVVHPYTPVVELLPGRQPFWHYPNLAGLRRQMESSGWRILETGRPFFQDYGAGTRREGYLATLKNKNWRHVPRQLLLRRGIPHTWVLAERWTRPPRPA